MECYKVLRCDAFGLLHSCSPPNALLECAYEEGKVTIAPFGGLLAFETLVKAQRFAESLLRGSQGVWLAEGYERVRLPSGPLGAETVEMYMELLDLYWGGVESEDALRGWPEGTVAFRGIKLVQRRL